MPRISREPATCKDVVNFDAAVSKTHSLLAGRETVYDTAPPDRQPTKTASREKK